MKLLIKVASVETDQELKFPWGHELIIAVGVTGLQVRRAVTEAEVASEFSSCLSVRLQELLPDQGLGSALTSARPQPRHHGGQTAAGFHQNSSQQQRRGSCSHCSRPVSEPPLFSPHLSSPQVLFIHPFLPHYLPGRPSCPAAFTWCRMTSTRGTCS